MTQHQRGVCVAIGKNKLIVQLQDVPGRIEGARAILMHGEMRHGLICKKGRLPCQLQKARNALRPVELAKQQQSPGIDRALLLSRSAHKAVVARELTIREVKGRRSGVAQLGKKVEPRGNAMMTANCLPVGCTSK